MRVTTAQNKISRGALFIREYGGVFIRHGLVELIQGTGEIIFDPPIIAESKADIEIRGLAAGGSGTMTASFSGYYGG